MGNVEKSTQLRGLGMHDFLIMVSWLPRNRLSSSSASHASPAQPIQRIPRYEMLLGALLKATEEKHVEHAELSEAYASVKKISGTLNNEITLREKQQAVIAMDSKIFLPPASRSAQPTERVGIVSPSRVFVLQGSFFLPRSLTSVAPQLLLSGAEVFLSGTDHEKRRFSRVLEPSGGRAGSASDGMAVTLLLFNDMLLVAKKHVVKATSASSRSLTSEPPQDVLVCMARIPIVQSLQATAVAGQNLLAIRSTAAVGGVPPGLLLNVVADKKDLRTKVAAWANAIDKVVEQGKSQAARKAAISQRLNVSPAAAAAGSSAATVPSNTEARQQDAADVEEAVALMSPAITGAGGRVVHYLPPDTLQAISAPDSVISIHQVVQPSVVEQTNARLLTQLLQGAAASPFDASAELKAGSGGRSSRRIGGGIAADMTVTVHEGPLQKRGGGTFSSFRTRWFVLNLESIRSPVPDFTPGLDVGTAAGLAAAADKAGTPFNLPFQYPLPEIDGCVKYFSDVRSYQSGDAPKGELKLSELTGVVWYGQGGDAKRFDLTTNSGRTYEIRAAQAPGATTPEAVQRLATQWVTLLCCVQGLQARMQRVHDDLERRKAELALFDDPQQAAEDAKAAAAAAGSKESQPAPVSAPAPTAAAKPKSAIPSAADVLGSSSPSPTSIPEGDEDAGDEDSPGKPKPMTGAAKAGQGDAVEAPNVTAAPPRPSLPAAVPAATTGASRPPPPANRSTSASRAAAGPVKKQHGVGKPPSPRSKRPPALPGTGSTPPAVAKARAESNASAKPASPKAAVQAVPVKQPTAAADVAPAAAPAVGRATSPPKAAVKQNPKPGRPKAAVAAPAPAPTPAPAPVKSASPPSKEASPPVAEPIAVASGPKQPIVVPKAAVRAEAPPIKPPLATTILEGDEDYEEEEAAAAARTPAEVVQRKQFHITPINPHLSGHVKRKQVRYSKPAMQSLDSAADVIARFRKAEKKNTGPRNQWNQHMWKGENQEEQTNLAPKIKGKQRKWKNGKWVFVDKNTGEEADMTEEEAAQAIDEGVDEVEDVEASPATAPPAAAAPVAAPKKSSIVETMQRAVPSSPPTFGGNSRSSTASSSGFGDRVASLPRQKLNDITADGGAAELGIGVQTDAAAAAVAAVNALLYCGEPVVRDSVQLVEARALGTSAAVSLAVLAEYARNGLATRALGFFADMRYQLGVIGLLPGAAGGSHALSPVQLARGYALVVAAFGAAGRVPAAQTWFAKGLFELEKAVAAWWRARPSPAGAEPTLNVCLLLLHSALLRAVSRAGLVVEARNVVKCMVARRLPVLPHHVHCVVAAAAVAGDHIAVAEELLRWMRRGHVPLPATMGLLLRALAIAKKAHSAAVLFDALTAGNDAHFASVLAACATLNDDGTDAGPETPSDKCSLLSEAGITRAQISQPRPVKRELTNVRALLMATDEVMRERKVSLSRGAKQPSPADSFAALKHAEGGTAALPSRPSPSPIPLHVPVLALVLQALDTTGSSADSDAAGTGKPQPRLAVSRLVSEVVSRLNIINGIGNGDLLAILKHQSGAKASGKEITGCTSLTEMFPLLAGKRAACAFVGADTSVYATMLEATGHLGMPQLGNRLLDYMKLTEREASRRQSLLEDIAETLQMTITPHNAAQIAQVASPVPGCADALDDAAYFDSVLAAAASPRVDSASAVAGTDAVMRRQAVPVNAVELNEATYAALATAHALHTSGDVNAVHHVVTMAQTALQSEAVPGAGVALAASLIRAHGARGDVASARRLYHEALAKQHAMQENAQQVRQQRVASQWLVPGGALPLLHCAFLDVLGRQGYLVEARTVGLSLLRPHDYVKAIAADAAVEEGEGQSRHGPTPPLRAAVNSVLLAEAAATRAIEEGTEPESSEVSVTLACMDVRVMTAITRAYAGAGHAGSVTHMADVMAQAGITPSVDTYGVVLSALSANKRNLEALEAAELLAAGSSVDAATAAAVDIAALLTKAGVPSSTVGENMGAGVTKHMASTRFGPLAKAAMDAVKQQAVSQPSSQAGAVGQAVDGDTPAGVDIPFSLTPNATPALAAVLQGRFARFPGESVRCQGSVGCLMTHVYIKAGLLPQARLVLAGVERGVAVRRKDIQGAYNALVAAFASEGASAAVDECLAAMEDSSQMSGEAEHSAAPVTHGAATEAPAGGDVHSMVGDIAASDNTGRDDPSADEAELDTAAGQSRRRGRQGLKKLFRAAANAIIVEQTYKKLMSSYGLQGKVSRARAMFEGVQRVRGTRTLGQEVASAVLADDTSSAKKTVGKALGKWAETAARANLDADTPAAQALADAGIASTLASMGDEANNEETLAAAASGLATVVQEGSLGAGKRMASPHPMFTSDEKADASAVIDMEPSAEGASDAGEEDADTDADAVGGMDDLVTACAPSTMAVTADSMRTGFAAEFERSAANMGSSSPDIEEDEAEAAAGDEAAAADADVATATGSLGAEAYNVLIDAYGEGCRLDMAVGTLSEMLQEGTMPNAGTLIALINGFSLSGRGAEVLGVMDQVVEVLSTRSHLSADAITRLIMDAGVVAARVAALGTAGRPDLVHAAWLAYCEYRLVTVAARAGETVEATILRSSVGSDDNVQRLLPVFTQYSDRPTAVAPDVHRALAESYLSAQAMALSRCGSNAYYSTTCLRSAAGMVRGLSAEEAAAASNGDMLRTALSTLPVPAQLDECVALMQDTVAALKQLGHPTSITSLTSLALAYRMSGMAEDGRALLVRAVGQIAQATSRSASAVRHQQVPVDAPTSPAGWGYGMDGVFVDLDDSKADSSGGLLDTARSVPAIGTPVMDDVRLDPEMLSALISTLGANGMAGEIRAVLESVARSAGVVDSARAVRSVRTAVGLQAAVEANADWAGGLNSSVTDMWNDLTDDLRHMLYAAFGMRRDVATADRLWRAGGYSARVYTKAITSRRGETGDEDIVSADHRGLIMRNTAGDAEEQSSQDTLAPLPGSKPAAPAPQGRRRRHRQSIALTPMNAMAPGLNLNSMALGGGSSDSKASAKVSKDAAGLPTEDTAAGDWIETAVLALVRNAQHNLLTSLAARRDQSRRSPDAVETAAQRMLQQEGVLGVVFDPSMNPAPRGALTAPSNDSNFVSAKAATASSFGGPRRPPSAPRRDSKAGARKGRNRVASAAVRRRPSMLMSSTSLSGGRGAGPSMTPFSAAALIVEEGDEEAEDQMPPPPPRDPYQPSGPGSSPAEDVPLTAAQREAKATAERLAGAGLGVGAVDDAGAMFSPLAAALKIAGLCSSGKVDSALGILLPWWRSRLERRAASVAAKRRSTFLQGKSPAAGRDAGAPAPRRVPVSGVAADDDSIDGVGVTYWSDSEDEDAPTDSNGAASATRRVKRRLPFRPLPETVTQLLHALVSAVRERVQALETTAQRRAQASRGRSKRASVSIGDSAAPDAHSSIHSDPMLALYEDVMWRLIRAVSVGGGMLLSDGDHAAVLELVAIRGRVKEACDRMVTQARADGTAALRSLGLSHMAGYSVAHNDAGSVAQAAAGIAQTAAVAGASITSFNAVLQGLASSPALTLKAAEYVALRMRHWYVPGDLSTASAVDAMSQRLKVDLHPLFATRSPRALHAATTVDPFAPSSRAARAVRSNDQWDGSSRPSTPCLTAALYFKLPGRPGVNLTSVTTSVGAVVGRWRGSAIARRVALLQTAIAKTVHTYLFSVGGVVAGGLLAAVNPLSIDVHGGILPQSLVDALESTLVLSPPPTLPGAASVREEELGVFSDMPETHRSRGYTLQTQRPRSASATSADDAVAGRQRARTMYPATDLVPLGGMGQGMWGSTHDDISRSTQGLIADGGDMTPGISQEMESLARRATSSKDAVDHTVAVLTLGSQLADETARRKLKGRLLAPPPVKAPANMPLDEEKQRAVAAVREAIYASRPEFGFYTADMKGDRHSGEHRGQGSIPTLDDIQRSSVVSTVLFETEYDRELRGGQAAENAAKADGPAATTYDFLRDSGMKASAGGSAAGLPTEVFTRQDSPDKYNTDVNDLSNSRAWRGMQSRMDQALQGRVIGQSPEKDPPAQGLDAAPPGSAQGLAQAEDARPHHPGARAGEALADKIQQAVLYQRPGGPTVVGKKPPPKDAATVASPTKAGASAGVHYRHDPSAEMATHLRRAGSHSPGKRLATMSGAEATLLDFDPSGGVDEVEASPEQVALSMYLNDRSIYISKDDVLTVRAELVSLSAELASTVAKMMTQEAHLNETLSTGARLDSFARATTGLGLRQVGEAALAEALAVQRDRRQNAAVEAALAAASSRRNGSPTGEESKAIIPHHLASAPASASDLIILSPEHPSAALPPMPAAELAAKVEWSKLIRPFSGLGILTDAGKRDVARRRVAALKATLKRLDAEQQTLSQRLAATTPHSISARELLGGYQSAVRDLNARERSMRNTIADQEAQCDALSAGTARDRVSLRAWAEGKPGDDMLHPESSILGQTGQVLRAARQAAAERFALQLDGMTASVAVLEEAEVSSQERVGGQRRRVDALVRSALALEDDMTFLAEDEADLAAAVRQMEADLDEAIEQGDEMSSRMYGTLEVARDVLAKTRVDADVARESGFESALASVIARGKREAAEEGRAAVEDATDEWAQATTDHADSVAAKLRAVRERVSSEMDSHLQPLLRDAEGDATQVSGQRTALEAQLADFESRLMFITAETGNWQGFVDSHDAIRGAIMSSERLPSDALRMQLKELDVQPAPSGQDLRDELMELMVSMRVPAVDQVAFIESMFDESKAQECAPDAADGICKLYALEGETREQLLAQAVAANDASAAHAASMEELAASHLTSDGSASPIGRQADWAMQTFEGPAATSKQLKELYAPPKTATQHSASLDRALQGLHSIAAAQERLYDAAEAQGAVRSPPTGSSFGGPLGLQDKQPTSDAVTQAETRVGADAVAGEQHPALRTGRLTGAYTQALLQSAGLSRDEAAAMAVSESAAVRSAAADSERGRGSQTAFSQRASFTPAQARARRASGLPHSPSGRVSFAGSAGASVSGRSVGSPGSRRGTASVSSPAGDKERAAAEDAVQLLRKASHGKMPNLHDPSMFRRAPVHNRKANLGGAGAGGGVSGFADTSTPAASSMGRNGPSSARGKSSARQATARAVSALPPSVTRAMLAKSQLSARRMEASMAATHAAQEGKSAPVHKQLEAASPASTSGLGRAPAVPGARGDAGKAQRVFARAGGAGPVQGGVQSSAKRGSFFGTYDYFPVRGAQGMRSAEITQGIEEGLAIRDVMVEPMGSSHRRAAHARAAAAKAGSTARSKAQPGRAYTGTQDEVETADKARRLDPTSSGRRGSYFGTYSTATSKRPAK